MSVFDSIAKVLAPRKGAPATSADLARLLDQAVAERDAAARAYSEHEQTREAAILAGEAGRTAFRAKLAELAADADDAVAAVELIRGRLEAARKAEEQAARKAAYDAALAKRTAAVKRLETEYPKLASGLRDLIRAIAEADQAVAEANAALPEGAYSPLLGVEDLARDLPYEGDEILSERHVELWCYTSTPRPIPPESAREVVSQDGQTGAFYRTDAAGSFRQRIEVNREKLIEVKTRKWRASVQVPRLATLSLPELRAGEPAFWTPLTERPEPSTILNRLDELSRDKGWLPAGREVATTYKFAKAEA